MTSPTVRSTSPSSSRREADGAQRPRFRSLIAAIALLALLASSWPSNAAPSEEDGGSARQVVIVVEDVRLIDDQEMIGEVLPVELFTQFIKISLSVQLDATVVGVAQPLKPDSGEADVFRLSSSAQRFGKTVVWVGELARPDDTVVRLGPVTVVDRFMFQPGSFVEIQRLVENQIMSRPAAVTRTVTVSVACFTTETIVGSQLAREIARELAGRIDRKPLLRYARAEGSVFAKPDCDLQDRHRGDAHLEGKINEKQREFDIRPILIWQGLEVPLPRISGSLDDLFALKDRYYDLLVDSTDAVVREGSTSLLQDLSRLPERSTKEAAQLGRTLLDQDKHMLSLAAFQKSLESPTVERFHGLGLAFAGADYSVFAEQTYLEALQFEDNDPKAHRELGHIAFERQDYAAAISRYETALDQDLNLPSVGDRLALAAYFVGDNENAKKYAELAVDRNEASPESFAILAELAMSTKSADQALDLLEKGLDAFPKHEGLVSELNEVGLALMYLNDPEALHLSRRAFDIAVAQNPDAATFQRRGQVNLQLAVRKSYEKETLARAIEDFEQASADKANSPHHETSMLMLVDLDLIEALFVSGDYDGSLKSARNAIESLRDIGSYPAIAHLFVAISEHMLGRKNPDREAELQELLGGYNGWPTLEAVINTKEGEPIKFLISEWSFTLLDHYLCTAVKPERQKGALRLNAMVQTHLGREFKGCEGGEQFSPYPREDRP